MDEKMYRLYIRGYAVSWRHRGIVARRVSRNKTKQEKEYLPDIPFPPNADAMLSIMNK